MPSDRFPVTLERPNDRCMPGTVHGNPYRAYRLLPASAAGSRHSGDPDTPVGAAYLANACRHVSRHGFRHGSVHRQCIGRHGEKIPLHPVIVRYDAPDECPRGPRDRCQDRAQSAACATLGHGDGLSASRQPVVYGGREAHGVRPTDDAHPPGPLPRIRRNFRR